MDPFSEIREYGLGVRQDHQTLRCTLHRCCDAVQRVGLRQLPIETPRHRLNMRMPL